MPAERFYTPVPSLYLSQTLALEQQESHHLLHVMRGKVGDRIELINGRGALADAQIIEIKKQRVHVEIKTLKQFPAPSFKIILAQAIPRINRLDTIIEKCTELGVNEIQLFPGDRSERKLLTDHQLERARALAIAAMKQCGRLHLPEIKTLLPIKNWNQPLENAFFGDVDSSAPIFEKIWKKQPSLKSCMIIIGPESGFTSAEADHLLKLQGKGVKLHQNILRTDTAPILCLSLISHWMLSE